jgi:hypothetical protein
MGSATLEQRPRRDLQAGCAASISSYLSFPHYTDIVVIFAGFQTFLSPCKKLPGSQYSSP